jgi:hypothetical protein
MKRFSVQQKGPVLSRSEFEASSKGFHLIEKLQKQGD